MKNKYTYLCRPEKLIINDFQGFISVGGNDMVTVGI